MKAFVFEAVQRVSGSYHSGGGLLIIAEDKDAAQALVDVSVEVFIEQAEWDKAIVLELALSYDPRIIVFPDAGCC